MPNFNDLDLLPPIKKAIKAINYNTPTPIQEKSIPHLLKGCDLLAVAQTGTGKTAAFSLPLLDRLGRNPIKLKNNSVRSLILTPTRELASQIELNIKSYAKNLKITSTVIFGGVSHRGQIKALSKGRDILIATPGRLLDLMDQGYIKYDQLEVFILDEADRMLDMGFINDVKKIIKKIPVQKQTLLFSATMPKSISTLAKSLLKKPVHIEITPDSPTVEKIDQKIHTVIKKNKLKLLKHVLTKERIKGVLIFTKTKRGANKAFEFLEKSDIPSAVIHGNKSQSAREKALARFRSGEVKILLATDIASRGIDVDHVSHVINYDLPEEPESYVHRIGRTARAGRTGIAISFCDETQLGLLKGVEKLIKFNLKVDKQQPYHIEKKDFVIEKPKKKTSQNAKRAFSRKSAASKNKVKKKRPSR